MAANIIYRTATQNPPSSTIVKNSPLTHEEMDGNFKSIVNEVDELANNLDGNLNFTTLAAATLPAADSDLLIIRQGATNKKLPMSALRDEFSVDGQKDLFVAGTHYVKNVGTSVTLSAVPAKPNTVKVFFNGVYQNKDTYYLVGSTINFGIVGTPAVIDSDSVEVQYEIPSQFVGLSVGEQAVLTAAQSNALASANAAAGSAVDALLHATDASGFMTAAEAARDAALLSRGIFETQAKALSAGVHGIASLVGGTGGTNGTFNLAFSGGAGSGAAGRFVVSGGSVVSVFISANGDSYTSSPTISFAASSGLVGASATAVIINNVDDGEYFSVPVSGSTTSTILYQRVAGTGVEICRYPSTSSASNAEYARYQLQGMLTSYTVSDTWGLDANSSATMSWTRLYMIVGASQLKIAAGTFTVANNEGLIIDLDQTPNGSAEYAVTKVSTFYSVDYTTGRKILLYGNSTGRVLGEMATLAALSLIKNDPELIYVKHTSGQLNVYVKGSNPQSNRYILYQFQRQTGTNNLTGLYAPYDVWRLNLVLEVEQTARYTFTSIRNITNAGETECAIQQQGKADFMGGQNHGNEVFSTVSLIVDGVQRDIATTGNYYCKRFELIVNSQLNEYGNSTNKLADKVTHWTIADRKATLENRIVWDEAVTVTFAYLTMISTYRNNPSDAGDNITNAGMREPLWQVETMATSAFSPTYTESRQCKIWGATSISVDIDMQISPDIPGWQFYFMNFTDRNKVYFGRLAAPYTTAIGEVWKSKAVIGVDTRN